MAAVDATLAGELGINPSIVLKLRREKMTEDTHWFRTDDDVVKYTDAGKALLRVLLGAMASKSAGLAATADPDIEALDDGIHAAPGELRAIIWKSDLRASAKLVLLRLLDVYRVPDGYRLSSIAQIAEGTSLGISTVNLSVTLLKKVGVFHRRRVANTTSAFTLTLDPLIQKKKGARDVRG